MSEIESTRLAITIENLLEKGFLNDFRTEKEKKEGAYVISKFSLTDKFKTGLFVDEEDAYIRAKSLYPDMVLINDKGVITRQSSKASAAKKDDYYRRIFYDKILLHGSKSEFAKFCVILGEMFDPENKGYPTKDANLGWDKFLLEWESISRDFERNMQKQETSWS